MSAASRRPLPPWAQRCREAAVGLFLAAAVVNVIVELDVASGQPWDALRGLLAVGFFILGAGWVIGEISRRRPS